MIPAILSGGSGTRLWPLSRMQFPKQFCELLDESLLEKTLRRVRPFGSPWTITVDDLEDLTLKIFRSQNIPQDQLIFEPVAKNTAAAVALLCRVLEFKNLKSEIAGIFPADHLVTNEPAFKDALDLAEKAARAGFVATLGIQPTHPSTGFGYIETKSKTELNHKNLTAHGVVGFREKPNRETAEKFLANGNFFWNAGIFVFQVSTMISNFERLMPELWEVMLELKPDLSNLKEIYAKAPAISIDYGIMEKLKEQVCIPCDIGWSDLGSWDDVALLGGPAREIKLSNKAHVVETGSNNCFVYSGSEKVVALVDVEDLIVVETEDALLISKQGRTQNVREVVQKLTKEKNSVAREHKFEVRPWGRFTILREEPHFKSKIVTVDPNQVLSCPSHTKRIENWVIVLGEAEVTLNDATRTVRPGDNVYVPAGIKHQIRNLLDVPLEFLEIQTGSTFAGDDTAPYQDDFNRKSVKSLTIE